MSTDPQPRSSTRSVVVVVLLVLLGGAAVGGYVAFDRWKSAHLGTPGTQALPLEPVGQAGPSGPGRRRDRGFVDAGPATPEPVLDEDLGVLRREKPKPPPRPKSPAHAAYADLQKAYASLEAIDGNKARKFTIRLNVLGDELARGVTPEREGEFVKQCRSLASELAELQRGIH